MNKPYCIILLLLISFSTYSQNSKGDADFLDSLLQEMTLLEKIGQLNLSGGAAGIPVIGKGDAREDYIRQGLIGCSGGIKSQRIAVNESRLGIPLIAGRDIIHGHTTIFPIPLASACSWNLPLIEKSARIAAIESTVSGTCWNYSPMVDISRDPRWGRIAECAGEDPWYGAQIAKAMVRGYQGDDLAASNTMMACMKHFALYGASEAGRDYNTVDMSRVSMFNEYMLPYKAAVDAGVGSVMTSFNLVEGIPATGNSWLMNDLLRDRWNFDGFVVTDYTAINEMMHHGIGDLTMVVKKALKAGVDMDMVGEGYMKEIPKLLEKNQVTIDQVNIACRRILEAKQKLGLFNDPFKYFQPELAKKVVLCQAHLDASLELAQQSIVLLKNQNEILPLKKRGTIGVIGPLAFTKSDLLGMWCAHNETDHLKTIYTAIKEAAAGKAKILGAEGTLFTTDEYLLNRNKEEKDHIIIDTQQLEQMKKEALKVARKSDVILAVMGETRDWSGEAASRADISLPKCQQDLLKNLLALNKPVVLVLANGRPLALKWENENVDAIVEAWHGGTRAAEALANVLFGEVNPSAKLTVSFPVSVGQIPVYYNQKRTGRPYDETYKFTSKYLDIPNEPLFPFGYGLSYTQFEYGTIQIDKKNIFPGDSLTVSVELKNEGDVDGAEVVQLYINDPVAEISRPFKELKNFQKVNLKAGESKVLHFVITTDDLKYYHSDLSYDYDFGKFNIYVGGNSRDVQEISFELKGR